MAIDSRKGEEGFTRRPLDQSSLFQKIYSVELGSLKFVKENGVNFAKA